MAVTAPPVSAWMLSIFWLMSSVARAVSLASSFTSLATTAKPFPASPARAASMVAFSASRLVCCAIEVITLITCPISALLWPSLVMVRLGGLGGTHRRGRNFRRLCRVLGNFLDAGAHFIGGRSHGLDVPADLFRTCRHHVGLVRRLPGTEADLLRDTAQLCRRLRQRLAHVRHSLHGRAKHLQHFVRRLEQLSIGTCELRGV